MPHLVAVLITLVAAVPLAVALPAAVVEVARRSSPDVVFSVDTDERLVALSIDDGPSAETPAILDVLAQHGARATFFVIGAHARSHPEQLRSVVSAGHEVANHTMNDAPSIALTAEELRANLRTTDVALRELGVPATTLFRPGSGWYDDAMVQAAADEGYLLVLGSVYPFDAQIPSAAVAEWYVRSAVRNGSIIVLHEGGARGRRTADALRGILPALARRGYRVVTVSELIDARR